MSTAVWSLPRGDRGPRSVRRSEKIRLRFTRPVRDRLGRAGRKSWELQTCHARDRSAHPNPSCGPPGRRQSGPGVLVFKWLTGWGASEFFSPKSAAKALRDRALARVLPCSAQSRRGFFSATRRRYRDQDERGWQIRRCTQFAAAARQVAVALCRIRSRERRLQSCCRQAVLAWDGRAIPQCAVEV